MAEIIEMPKLSDTMEEGAIGNWLKKEGDFVEEGEPLVEIETDKATMEYESPEEGILLKIVVGNGEKCQLNAPIAVIGEKGESFDLSSLGSKEKSTAKEQAPKADAPKSAPTPTAAPQQTGSRVKASPLAKRVAKEKGIALENVSGSGPNGRIIVRDLEGTTAAAVAPSATSYSSNVVTGEDRIVPVNMMRSTIAKRLLSAKNDAPHFYLKRTVNMERVDAWRAKLNKEAESFKGEPAIPRVSVNDIIMLACAKALRKHPQVNSSWEGEQIREFAAVHVAMAVALPGGLITPVVRNTDHLGVREIAIQTKDLAKKAKAGSLGPNDYAGGTFTVSNLGMMGIDDFTAIINPPQSCILAVGATKKVPFVNEKDEIVVEPRMTITMSCDHRVVDGAVGASFLQTLVAYLEDPAMMLS
jgi:pyruvate dehydrogenase E2 component (dihydrolipoamide acetyltransferase)